MKGKKNLSLTGTEQENVERVVARLEGKMDDQTAKIWGEEFAASGGGKPPVPPNLPAS